MSQCTESINGTLLEPEKKETTNEARSRGKIKGQLGGGGGGGGRGRQERERARLS